MADVVREDTLIYRIDTKKALRGIRMFLMPLKFYGYCLKAWCKLFRKSTIEIQLTVTTEVV